jgi:hypothetical protein
VSTEGGLRQTEQIDKESRESRETESRETERQRAERQRDRESRETERAERQRDREQRDRESSIYHHIHLRCFINKLHEINGTSVTLYYELKAEVMDKFLPEIRSCDESVST